MPRAVDQMTVIQLMGTLSAGINAAFDEQHYASYEPESKSYSLFYRAAIFLSQRFNRNSEPFRSCCAIREQGHVERRIIGQHSVQFGVMSGGRTGDIEGGFDGRLRLGGEPPVQRDVKNELEIQVYRIKRG